MNKRVKQSLSVVALLACCAAKSCGGGVHPSIYMEAESGHGSKLIVAVNQNGDLPYPKHITSRTLWVTVDRFDENTGAYTIVLNGSKKVVLAPDEYAHEFDFHVPKGFHYQVIASEDVSWGRGFGPRRFTGLEVREVFTFWPDGTVTKFDPNGPESRP